MIRVQVPATSANVGPGFDCMGLALNTYADIRFEIMEAGLRISGCPAQWQTQDNFIYQSFCKVYDMLHRPIPPVSIQIDTKIIPDARGLGSSAICIVAGVLAANAYNDHILSKQEILKLCTEMEGHPDNVAPALYGGLVISFPDQEEIVTACYDVSSQYHFVTMIPDYPILTKDARAVLPKQVPYQDALYNIGRCAVLAKGLQEGDHYLVAHACDDRLHQPYRKVLFPQYEEIDALCHEHHVLTWYISGSGSTMAAITEKAETANALAKAIKERYPSWLCPILQADTHGAIVEEV